MDESHKYTSTKETGEGHYVNPVSSTSGAEQGLCDKTHMFPRAALYFFGYAGHAEYQLRPLPLRWLALLIFLWTPEKRFSTYRNFYYVEVLPPKYEKLHVGASHQ